MDTKHEWIPDTLFEMAAFCEQNAMQKPREVLIEAALMLRICLANLEANGEPLPGPALPPPLPVPVPVEASFVFETLPVSRRA